MPKATRILPLSPYHNLSAGDLVDRLIHYRKSAVTTVAIKARPVTRALAA
jgi:hypothetical protein